MKIDLIDEQIAAIVVSELKLMIECYQNDVATIESGGSANSYVYGDPEKDLILIKEQIVHYEAVLRDFTTPGEL